ncbi:hypothetical protein RJ639_028628 [Escallonia herrerae]|uniref:Uncharacterized protein n=1 Tax=Escallonia herrerae TaxID=1293975 RepID=A0AA88XAR6_9ASTE|nr:hypothetical protein RJ639_028628 [Escallonia herrerae]
MANSRFARFITEVAPPQFISLMRYRATQMLDTINEEERECSANDSLALAPKSMLSSLSSGAKRALVKEVLTEKAQSRKPFDTHTLRSRLSSYDLKTLRDRCDIPPSIKLRLPDDGEAANMMTIDEIGVYYDRFINGFRVSIHPFFLRKLNAYGLALDQFSPHVLDLTESDLEHIKRLKGAEPLESKYPLKIMSSRGTHGSASGGRGDSLPLFNAQGVLGDIIPDELASIHRVDEEIQDLNFDALISKPQPKKSRAKDFVLGLVTKDKGKEAPGLILLIGLIGTYQLKSLFFKSSSGAWECSSKAIIPMDRIILSTCDISHTANGMVQVTSQSFLLQALAHVRIGVEKLIAAEMVLDEERKSVHVENNFCREAEKKVKDLTKSVGQLELSKASLAVRIASEEATRQEEAEARKVVALTRSHAISSPSLSANAPVKPYKGEETNVIHFFGIPICEKAPSKMMSAKLPVSTKMRWTLPLENVLALDLIKDMLMRGVGRSKRSRSLHSGKRAEEFFLCIRLVRKLPQKDSAN